MKQIGKYVVEGLLGRGGMSRVYKVRVPVINRIVALKSLEPDPLLVATMGAKRLRELFRTEAATMAGLRHPNVVDVWDFEETSTTCFYVMGYYALNLGVLIGESYRTDEPSRIISIRKAADYIHQVLEGLDCLHAAGIIHRDIKPYNLLVTETDTVKICDFGLSRQHRETVHTPDNLKVGSPWYAAPEQEANPQQADARADLYAVGVILYRMLTGQLPELDSPPARQINPDVDADWDAFLTTALAPNPRDRFESALSMQQELATCFVRWESHQAKRCKLPPTHSATAFQAAPSAPLRSRARKVPARQAVSFFGLTARFSPRRYTRNHFETCTDQTVTDHTTGLLWQQSGFRHLVTWHQAQEHVQRMNREEWGGRDTWRLPTIDELLTLLQPTPHGEDFCIPPVFDTRQKWLWSCDRSSFTAAWYVSLMLGFVSCHDFSGAFYLKAVC